MNCNINEFNNDASDDVNEKLMINYKAISCEI